MTYCHSLEYPLFFYPCKLFPQPFIQSSFNPLNPARRGRAVCSYDDLDHGPPAIPRSRYPIGLILRPGRDGVSPSDKHTARGPYQGCAIFI